MCTARSRTSLLALINCCECERRRATPVTTPLDSDLNYSWTLFLKARAVDLIGLPLCAKGEY